MAKTDARDFECRYAYDALGNLREQLEGERVTTFEYDRANRSLRVHYPATRRVEVDAAGAVSTTENYRAVAHRAYDANGNALTEVKPDGELIEYRFDRGNRQVAALNDGVYAAYGYNFAGDLTRIHRYLNPAASLDAPPAAQSEDQVIRIEVDKLGRKTAERQFGDGNDSTDDRVVQYGYDANGNQVQTTDARGFASTLVYDVLNRVIGTVNREGGVTQTSYDAQGNVVARQTGGWSAPQLRGGVREDLVSDRGLVIEWSTDHATDGIVYLRPAGSAAGWTAFGVNGGHVLDHSVVVAGLAADTAYEYYFVSKDAFGYTIESTVRSVRTAVGLDAVAVGNVRQAGSGFQADLHFSLPAGASAARVLVGRGAAGAVELQGESAATPTQQGDGSYSVTLDFASADAVFQIEWTDAAGVHRTGASAIQQRVDTRRFDATVRATPQSQGSSDFRLTVGWNLADVLAEGGIDSDGGQPPRYSVFIGSTVSAGQTPNYVQATLVDGVFTAQFDAVREGARALHLQFTRPDGSTASATPLALSQLAGLDRRLQNLEFAFPDADTSGTQLLVRTRPAGATDWVELPASAIDGLSANLLGLAVGNHEYEVTLVRGGQTLRKTGGNFTMREPASIGGLTDQANTGAVQHTIDDAALSLPGLLPVAANETLTVTLTDAQGNAAPAGFANGTLDLAALEPGSYTLRALKTRTTSTTSGTPPVTTTTTTTVNDIGGTIVVGPLTLTNVVAGALEGSRSVTAYALDATRTSAAEVTVGGSSSADHSWNYFDGNGWRTFSNENGGVWTRYFYDGAGNVTKEVRFQRRDANGAFVNAISDEATRPSLAQLVADYDAALAAGAEHVRVTTRSFDAAKNKLTETEHSTAHGAVTTRTEYDRFNNKTLEISAAGIAGLENTMRMAYDGFNRVLRTEGGAFEHRDEAGTVVTSGAVQSFGYDARGNKSTHTDARGFTERFHYDAFNHLASQWDGQREGSASTLRTDYVYDAFDRVAAVRANDLTGRAAQAVQVMTLTWTTFDQLRSHTDALDHTVQRSYDAGGNQLTETDARGNTESYAYNAEGKLIRRTDRLGASSNFSYDAYGQKLSETDANARVTTYTLGAFGQILGSRTAFNAGYGSLAGEASMSDTSRFDWLGRLTDSQDSFGKHFSYGYNDADEQIRIADLTYNRAVDYVYDALGRRTEETLTQNGLAQRHQTNGYNNQGWLTGVQAEAGYDAGGGASLNQQLNVAYQFDAEGNRVRVGDGQYSYDAAGRMTSGFDDKRNETVVALVYDGYGNRVHEARGDALVSYTYDAANRVRTSTAGETWDYDANGNTTAQRTREGHTSSTEYNAENRSTRSVSTSDGKSSTSVNTYDAAGNVVKTRVDSDSSGFDEVTQRDVRYLERSKVIANSHAKGAKGLEGSTSFTYDANGNLTMVDRGRKQGAGENSVAVFEYDLEGHIIGRADKATAQTTSDFFEGSDTDPDAAVEYDEYGGGLSRFALSRQRFFNNSAATGSTTRLQSYLYANNKQISEAAGDQVVALRKLTLAGEPIIETVDLGSDNGTQDNIVGWQLTLQDADIVRRGDGSIDRTETAKRLAARGYQGFSALSADAQARITSYVQGQLPADAQVQAGAKVRLHGFIQLMDASYANLTQITDYSVRQLGADGIPGGTVQTHVVRAGDTLQGIAAMYFGSPAYWYLIADANGLVGNEPLAEGTTLTIPNAVANSANDADTFKVYNESEIIGSTSPEIRTIKKKKKWYQKLIQVLIIVIMIVAAIITAGAALAIAGAATPGLLAMGASLAGALGATGLAGVAAFAAAAAIGAAVYAAASILTQGLAVASGLQEKFSWKAVGKAAVSGAISGGAGFLGAASGVAQFFGGSQTAARVAVEVGKQLIVDGKISNVAGIAGAVIGGGALGDTARQYTSTITAGLSMLEGKVRGRGDNAMSWVSLATAAIFDSGMLSADGDATNGARGPATGPRSPQYFTEAGQINWKVVAVQAVGAAIVADRMGEDAAISYVGNAVGEFAVQAGGRYYDNLVKQRQEAARSQQLYGLGSGGPAEGLKLGGASGPRLGQPSPSASIDPEQGPMGSGTGPSEEEAGPPAPRPAGEQAAEDKRKGRYGVTVGEKDTVIAIAKREYGDNWRAGVAVIAAINNLKTDRYGNPIVVEGQDLNLVGLDGADADMLKKLGRLGGELVAGNTRQRDAVRAGEAQQAMAAELRRLDARAATMAASTTPAVVPDDPVPVSATADYAGIDYGAVATQMEGGAPGQATVLVKTGFVDQMRNLSQALHVPQGVVKNSYDQAAAGMENRNNSIGERFVYGALATATLPLAIGEELFRGLLNVPSEAVGAIPRAADAGENTAAAMDSRLPTSDRIVAGLAATRDYAFAFTGLGSVAAPLAPSSRMGPAVTTAEELALQKFPGAEATAAARATYVEAGSVARSVTVLESRSATVVNEAMVSAGNQPAWLAGTDVVTEVVPQGVRYNMVVSEGQAQALMQGKPAFGGWASPAPVPSQAYARNNLVILEEFKPDVSFVATVETTAPQTVNRGLTGPLGPYTGNAPQVEFLGQRNLRLVGQPQPLPLTAPRRK